MELRVLAVGDVVGDGGLRCLEQHLRSLKKLYRIDFCVVNGENASGTGLTPKQADQMLDAGADILTLGNHSFDRREVCAYLDKFFFFLFLQSYSFSYVLLRLKNDFHTRVTAPI